MQFDNDGMTPAERFKLYSIEVKKAKQQAEKEYFRELDDFTKKNLNLKAQREEFTAEVQEYLPQRRYSLIEDPEMRL